MACWCSLPVFLYRMTAGGLLGSSVLWTSDGPLLAWMLGRAGWLRLPWWFSWGESMAAGWLSCLLGLPIPASFPWLFYWCLLPDDSPGAIPLSLMNQNLNICYYESVTASYSTAGAIDYPTHWTIYLINPISVDTKENLILRGSSIRPYYGYLQ